MPRTGRKENLIPLTERSSEEVREMQRRGGIASGETRRFKKTLREIVQEMYEEETDVVKDGKHLTGAALVKFSVTKALSKGDKTAVQALGVLASLDEKKVEVNANVQTADLTDGMSNADLKKAIAEMMGK